MRTSHPLIAASLTDLGASWRDSKTNVTSVWLEKGPRSCRADMPWSDDTAGSSCICSAVFDLLWEDLVFGVARKRGWCKSTVYLMPGVLGALQSTCGLCTTWHQGNDDWDISKDVGSLTSNWTQPWPPCTRCTGISQSGTVHWKVTKSHDFNGNQGPLSSLKIALCALVPQL